MLVGTVAVVALAVAVCLGEESNSSTPIAVTQASPIWNVTCPSQCVCEIRMSQRLGRTLRTVDCSHQKLKAVPWTVPRDAQALLLRANFISDLHDTVPELIELQELDVSNNKLRSLGRGFIFHNLSELVHLNLAKNDLSTVFKEVFSGLIRLESLVLTENKLSYIEDQAFRSLTRLHSLEIASNQLSALYVEWFAGLGGLSVLNVAGNRIHHVNSVVFRPLRRLQQAFLQNNRIADVAADAFVGLERLQVLHLENNQLTQVPAQALRSLVALRALYLNGNPIARINEGDFANLPMQELNLNHLPSLTIVEATAFHNVSLTTLQLHDNPRLVFVDHQAFANVSQLKEIYLHNNRLEGLSKAMLETLPAGVEISLYGNPLRCDCNIRWIRQEMASNNSRISFSEANHLKCASPDKMAEKPLRDLDIRRLLKECPPHIVATVNGSVEKSLGDSVRLDCRALGLPPPRISWVMPDGRVVNESTNAVRVQLRPSGTLSFYHLKVEDSGEYTCVAQSSAGQAEATVQMTVKRIDIHIFPTSISSTFVALVWNGTARNKYTKYTLMYRVDPSEQPAKGGSIHPHAHSSPYQRVVVSSYMRSYTVNNLQPDTTYEFCIAFEDKDGLFVQISCSKVRTRDASYMMQGIHRTSNIAVAVVLGIVAAMLMVICMVTLAARKYRQRQYENPDKPLVSNMSQIPLENLYSPLMSNIGS